MADEKSTQWMSMYIHIFDLSQSVIHEGDSPLVSTAFRELETLKIFFSKLKKNFYVFMSTYIIITKKI